MSMSTNNAYAAQSQGYNANTAAAVTPFNSTSAAPTASSSTSVVQAPQKKKSTCSCEIWRMILLFFLVGTVGCSGVSIYFEKWKSCAGVEDGSIRQGWDSTSSCADGGFNIGQRMIVVFAMAICGGAFALIAIFFVFFTACGAGIDIARHVFCFLSGACQITATVMMLLFYPACGITNNCTYGTCFWVACAAAGGGIISFLISIVQQCAASFRNEGCKFCCTCCKYNDDDDVDDGAATTAGPSQASTAANDQQMIPQQQQQQPYYNNNNNNVQPEAVRQLDYSVAGASDTSMSGLGISDAFDKNDPTSCGLNAEDDWEWQPESNLFWSHKLELYYNVAERSYGDPNSGKWSNENGEWE